MKEIKDAKELLDEELDKVTGGAPVDNLAQYLLSLSQDKTLTDEQRAKIQINLAHYICYIREQDEAHKVPFDPDIDWVEIYNNYFNK